MKTDFKFYLLQSVKNHPIMQPRDVVKLCYQGAFGAEHLLRESAGAWAFFQQEWNATTVAPAVPIEPVSWRYDRVNLGTWKKRGLPPWWLFQMFYLTASEEKEGQSSELQSYMERTTAFRSYLDLAEKLCLEGLLPFTEAEWRRCRTDYESGDGGPVHHSEPYRAAENPAYRVVSRDYTALIPVLERMSAMQNDGRARVVAIDGRAAAGKTTLARRLQSVTGAGVVHMDDFFLPPGLRTPERLAEAGGNVHYERFAEEVLPSLRTKEAFSYRRFDCGTLTYGADRAVAASDWRIVEGSYSHHPYFGAYMDLRLFCHIAPGLQLERIRSRDGEMQEKNFAAHWIPMEEKYLKKYSVQEKADLVIESE